MARVNRCDYVILIKIHLDSRPAQKICLSGNFALLAGSKEMDKSCLKFHSYKKMDFSNNVSEFGSGLFPS
jgi:hypothetical protein